MSDIQAEKIVKVGDGPFVEAAVGRYYVNEKGERVDKAPVGEKYTRGAAVLLQITIPALTDEVKAAAIEHSFTRKLQEMVQAEARKESPDFPAFADKFGEMYAANMLHEKAERAAGAKVDSVATIAVKSLAAKLKELDTADPAKIADAKTPLPEKVFVKKDDQVTDKVNYLGWAKALQAGNHPWYGVFYKKAQAAQDTKLD